ncbi:MAG: hypothetical protein RIQ89_616 [Bacteroidota bacterium]|jgi:rhamnosyltransferase
MIKVALIGSRGAPNNYGGFEFFVEQLAPRLADKGIDITVVNERSNRNVSDKYKIIFSDYNKANNPFRFYINSLSKAVLLNDICIVCGLGAAWAYPLYAKHAKLITITDGIEEHRKRFNIVKKFYIKGAYFFARFYSSKLIGDARQITQYLILNKGCRPESVVTIPYAPADIFDLNDSILLKLNLEPKSYALVISRLVPENSLNLMLSTLSNLNIKTVVVGDYNQSSYSRKLYHQYKENILFTGANYDVAMVNSLRSNCKYYLHGHTVGGTNPGLLEAMKFNLLIFAHDNEFNREVTANRASYFSDEESLKQLLFLDNIDPVNYVDLLQSVYNWNLITETYYQLILTVYGANRP